MRARTLAPTLPRTLAPMLPQTLPQTLAPMLPQTLSRSQAPTLPQTLAATQPQTDQPKTSTHCPVMAAGASAAMNSATRAISAGVMSGLAPG